MEPQLGPAGAPPGQLPPGGPAPGGAPASQDQMSAGIKAKADQMVQGAGTLLSMAMPMYGPGTEEGKAVMEVLKHLSTKFSLTSGPDAMKQMIQHLSAMKQGAPGGAPAGAPPQGGQPPMPPQGA